MKKYIELALRFYICLKIGIYAVGKMAGGQFYDKGELPPNVAVKPLQEVGSFELAWTFFGYSYEYVLFIGISQLVGGLLLLWDKTKLLGVAILIPILLNIIIVDVFFKIGAGALFSAVFYFFCLMVILFLNQEKVKILLQTLFSSPLASPFSTKQLMINALIIAVSIVVLFALESFFMRLLSV